MLSRAHFLVLLPIMERVQVASNIREQLHEGLRQLERLEARIATLNVPEDFTAVAHYQKATLQYGLAWYRSTLAWAEEHLPSARSEEHTSELQSRGHLVCRLLLEKK